MNINFTYKSWAGDGKDLFVCPLSYFFPSTNVI